MTRPDLTFIHTIVSAAETCRYESIACANGTQVQIAVAEAATKKDTSIFRRVDRKLTVCSVLGVPAMNAVHFDSCSGVLRRPSPRLTFDDATEVWKRHFLGEAQHHIAQAFGVDQGRISEILKERRLVASRAAALGSNSVTLTTARTGTY